ncbi:hypothetical protein AAHH17_23290, partial [Lysinibacillus capsici]|uniref:Ig-like domain-containing protein n=1 Tax=Lysinibacillus capsici TaxID=2115968 RepID=UPI0032E817C9
MFTGLNYAVIDLNTKEIVYTGTVDVPAVGSKTGGVAQVTILPLDNSLLLTFVDSSALVRYSLNGNTLVKMQEASSQGFGGNTTSTAHIYGASSNVIFIRNSALGQMGYFQYNASSIDTNSKITHFGSYNKSLGVGQEQVWAENDTVLYGAPSYKFSGGHGAIVGGLAVLGVDKVIAISSAKVSLFTKGASSFTVITLSNRPSFASIQTGVENTANGFLLQSYEESALCSVSGTNIVQHKMFAERLEFVGETETHIVFRKNNGGTYTQFIIYESNKPPTSTTIPTQSTQLAINKTVNLSSYFSDPDGDTLTYTASSSATNVGTVSVSGSTLTLKPVGIGSTTITVTANDGKGGTKSTTFTFSVVNSAPTVTLSSPTANQTLYENDTLNIVGTAIDTDPNQSVTVYYQIDDNPKKVLAANLSQIQIA